jgi:ribosomal protein L35AE/L33A
MTSQQVTKYQSSYGKIIDFSKFKDKRPFFQKLIKIQVETPTFDTYYIVKNVVYKEKQILALKKEMCSNTIFLVEAKIIDSQLKYISMLPNECLGEICGIFFTESVLINH